MILRCEPKAEVDVAGLQLQAADSDIVQRVEHPPNERPVVRVAVFFLALLQKPIQFFARIRMWPIQSVRLDRGFTEIQNTWWAYDIHFDDERFVVVARQSVDVEFGPTELSLARQD